MKEDEMPNKNKDLLTPSNAPGNSPGLASEVNILGLFPPPEPVVLLRIYEARNKTGDTFSITEHRIGFSGVPFEGSGSTPEEAWEEFENELDACENWLDLPESTRLYSSPVAFLWLKEARQTGDLREKFGPALNE